MSTERQSGARLIEAPEWFRFPETHFAEPSSYLREQFNTVDDATAAARQIGVPLKFGDRLDLANMAVELLRQLVERKMPLPTEIRADEVAFRYYADSASIAAKTEGKIVTINPGSQVWRKIVEIAAYQGKVSRFWSTPHPLHPFYHEAGHVMLNRVEKQATLTKKQMTMAASVSRRAGDDAEEFVCEIFAGLMCGVRYDSDIVGAYKRLGGQMPYTPKPPKGTHV